MLGSRAIAFLILFDVVACIPTKSDKTQTSFSNKGGNSEYFYKFQFFYKGCNQIPEHKYTLVMA